YRYIEDIGRYDMIEYITYNFIFLRHGKQKEGGCTSAFVVNRTLILYLLLGHVTNDIGVSTLAKEGIMRGKGAQCAQGATAALIDVMLLIIYGSFSFGIRLFFDSGLKYE
ncbi:hypothetical protein ACJX0J_030262, partial [Zea mays]